MSLAIKLSPFQTRHSASQSALFRNKHDWVMGICYCSRKSVCASSNEAFYPDFWNKWWAYVICTSPQCDYTTYIHIQYCIYACNEKCITSAVPYRICSRLHLLTPSWPKPTTHKVWWPFSKHVSLHHKQKVSVAPSPSSAARKNLRICCEFKGGVYIYIYIYYLYMLYN